MNQTECATGSHNIVHEYDEDSLLGDSYYCTKCDWWQVG